MSVVSVPAPAPARTARGWSFTWTRVRVVLLTLVGLAAGVGIYRLVFGLGAATNLSDRWPWGLWIWWDVLTGVALAGGGYSTALLVHFLGREKWKEVERGALLTSMLGYIMVVVGLLLDLGRWYRAWHPIVYWGYHSVMFELFFCVGGYTVVQMVEFAPIALERFHAPRAKALLRKIYAPVLIVGIVLPFLHQSALGSLWVTAKGRLDPLWWTLLIPLLFFMSSFFVGPAMVTLENHASARARGRRPPTRVLSEMVRVSGWLMALYFLLKVGDLAWRGQLGRAFNGSTSSDLFLAEIVLGILVPMAMFASPRIRSSTAGLVTASALVVGGVALNRANVAFTALAGSARGATYFPSWMELAVTIGLICAAVLAYLFISENFPVDEEPARQPARAVSEVRPALR